MTTRARSNEQTGRLEGGLPNEGFLTPHGEERAELKIRIFLFSDVQRLICIATVSSDKPDETMGKTPKEDECNKN